MNTDPDPGFLMIKNWQNFTSEKKFDYLSLGFHKGLQATGEAFSPQKKTFSASKHGISIFWVIVALLDPDSESGTGFTELIESGSNPDPYPKHW
jgi:hypothetical protein